MAGNILSSDSTSDRIYLHSGFSSTISNSFSSPSTEPRGLNWDGTNTLSCDGFSDKVYLHSGFSSTISNSFSSPSSAPRGLAWDGTNIQSSDNASDKVYLHSGFSSTISNSFSSPSDSPGSSAWDGTNSLVLENTVGVNVIYKQSGFTSTVSSSFSSPSDSARGLGWDGSNTLSCDSAISKIYLHSGFTSTISNSFASPSTGASGLTDDSWSGSAAGIAFDAASNSGEQLASASYSWNHTCTGSNRYLTVKIGMLSLAQTVSNITYNSVPMQFIGARNSVTGATRIELWGLIAPSTGANSIAVTLTGAINSGGVAASYTGVHQTSPTEAFNSAQATNVGAADATVSVTTVADNDWVVDGVVTDDTSITVGAGQTQRNNIAGTVGSVADSDEGPKTPAGAVTMSWTGIGALATWAIAAVAIRPIAAATLPGVTFLGYRLLMRVGS